MPGRPGRGTCSTLAHLSQLAIMPVRVQTPCSLVRWLVGLDRQPTLAGPPPTLGLTPCTSTVAELPPLPAGLCQPGRGGCTALSPPRLPMPAAVGVSVCAGARPPAPRILFPVCHLPVSVYVMYLRHTARTLQHLIGAVIGEAKLLVAPHK